MKGSPRESRCPPPTDSPAPGNCQTQEGKLGHRNLGFSSAQALGAVKPLPTQCPEQPGHQDQLQEEVDQDAAFLVGLLWVRSLSSLRPRNLRRVQETSHPS